MTSDVRLSSLIAPSFFQVHRAVKSHQYTHYRLEGGRGSAKSSFISIEIPLLLKQNPQCHALVMRKVANTLRDSVYAQYLWAISMLGLEDEFIARVAPLELIYKPTGQKIMFRGADDKSKIKSIKVPFGYIGITHFEEKDQFAGREEIRSILQSTMRGGRVFWNFESNNPPISSSNWANVDSLQHRPDSLNHKSCYLDVPKEWLGEQFFAEADHLKSVNTRAYRHEYLGEVVGTGGNVFENVDVKPITDKQIQTEFASIYMGVDWGWYPDPWAWNRMCYDPAHQTLYIYDEMRRNKCGNEETARLLKEEKGVDQTQLIIADSAEEKSIADYRAMGLWCRPVVKGPGSVEYSMKWLQRLNKIVIDPRRCPCTAKEFLEYEYERTKSGEIISGYPDKNNHHIDAVRYALYPVWKRRGQ